MSPKASARRLANLGPAEHSSNQDKDFKLIDTNFLKSVLPYVCYVGMHHAKRYDFQAVFI